MKTIIHPLGHERTKIIARLGRDHYAYDGIPEQGYVKHEHLGVIEVWFFDYSKFDADVQLLMAKRDAYAHNCSLPDAIEHLKRVKQAIPCNQIELEQVEA